MSRSTTPRLRLGFAVVCAALVLTYVLLPGPWRGAVTAVASALLAVVVAHRLHRRTLPDPAPWHLVLAAAVTLTVHNLESVRHTALLGRVAGTGVLHDLTLPLGYGLVLAASLLVISRYARRDTAGVTEAVLVGFAVAMLLWVLAIGPELAARGAPSAERRYDLVVTLLLCGTTGAVLHAARTSRAARPALVPLLVAAVVTLAGTTAGVLAIERATGGPPWWLDIFWIVAYTAMSTAAADRSLLHLPRDDRSTPTRLTGRRTALLGGVLGLGPVLAAVQQLRGEALDASLLLLGSSLMVPLALLRVAGLVRLHTATQAQLTRLATVDALTGLPNRRALNLHLEASLDRVRAARSDGVVVLFLDVDGLKVVNDSHGHAVGDRLLVAVARRLRSALGEDVFVGRFGGDEFVVVAEGDPEHVRDPLVDRVRQALTEAVDLGAVVAAARASVGVAEARPGEQVTAARLIATADAHMYDDKREVRPTGSLDGGSLDGGALSCGAPDVPMHLR